MAYTNKHLFLVYKPARWVCICWLWLRFPEVPGFGLDHAHASQGQLQLGRCSRARFKHLRRPGRNLPLKSLTQRKHLASLFLPLDKIKGQVTSSSGVGKDTVSGGECWHGWRQEEDSESDRTCCGQGTSKCRMKPLQCPSKCRMTADYKVAHREKRISEHRRSVTVEMEA